MPAYRSTFLMVAALLAAPIASAQTPERQFGDPVHDVLHRTDRLRHACERLHANALSSGLTFGSDAQHRREQAAATDICGRLIRMKIQ